MNRFPNSIKTNHNLPPFVTVAIIGLMLFVSTAFAQRRRTLAKTSNRPTTKMVTKKAAIKKTAIVPAKRRTIARTNRRERVDTADPSAGDNSTGEDPVIRQAAVDALGNVPATMVVADPQTGRVLTVVNQKLAFSGGFIPCSTFKPAVALAALQEGLITSDSNRLLLGKRWYLDLEQSLAHSNNLYFEKLGAALGLEKMREYATKFGFDEAAGWGIQDERPSSFPQEAPPASMGGVAKVASFGQGISQTLFQEVSFMSALANGGTIYYLQYPRSEDEIENFHPRVKRTLDIQPWLAPVREGMMGAVQFGTARRAQQPDMPVLGKTGTCSEDGKKLGWFVGFNERENGRLAFAVLQRTSYPLGGGAHAAQIAGRFFRNLTNADYFNRPLARNSVRSKTTLPASAQLF